MSRIGNALITIPEGVEVNFSDGLVTVKGKKGELTQTIDSSITVSIEDGQINCSRESDSPDTRSKHGLYRSLINNMVIGVSEGYKTVQELVGVGYRAKSQGQIFLASGSLIQLLLFILCYYIDYPLFFFQYQHFKDISFKLGHYITIF